MNQKKLELAIGYCRVSTRKQEKKGLSLDAQEDYIKNWVSGNGHDLVKIFKVQESGGDSERKHLNKAFVYCIENGIKNILITDSDRWTRSREMDVEAQKFIKKHDLKVHIIRERRVIGQFGSVAEEFAHNVLVDAGQMVRDMIKEKIMAGIKQKLGKGEYPGIPPMGYRSVKRTDNSPHKIEQTEDAPKVKRLLETFSSGKFTIRQAIRLARDIGLRPPKKKDMLFTKGALAKTIKSRFYYGEFSWGGKVYENKTTGFEPIISKKTWKQNQEIIEKRTKNFKGRGLSFLFNQLMVCGKCGRVIHGVKFDHTTSWKTKKGTTEKKYSYQPRYVCTKGNYYLYKGANFIPKESVDAEALAVKEDIFFKNEKTGKNKIRFKEGTPLTAHKCDMPSFKEEEMEKMVMKEIGLIKFNKKHWEGIKKDLFKDETKEFLDFEIRELRSEATNNEIKLDKMYDDYQKEIIDAEFFKSRSEKIRERQAEVKDRLSELEEEREAYDDRIGNAIEILDSFKNWEKIFKEATIEKKNHILRLLTIKISTSCENTILGNKEIAYKGLEVEFTPEVSELFRMGILERVDRNRRKHTDSKSFNCIKTRYSCSDH